jgi:starch synthase
MNIVFAISEVEDLVKTGGLADVGKALPLALRDLGHNVSIVIPYYQAIAERYSLADACTEQTLFTEGQVYHFRIKHLDWNGINLYMVDYPEYFNRSGLYSSTYEAYEDNGERFSFFSGAVLKTLQALNIQPHIIHCHDWHTAMLPFILRHDPSEYFAKTKTIFTIHNAAFQGVNHIESIPFLRQHPEIHHQVHGGYINFLQSAIAYADKITTVSPTYASELLTDLGSHGLHEMLVRRASDLTGILNGCDYSQWNPLTDTLLPYHYSLEDMTGKAQCKAELQQRTELPQEPRIPVIGMVCRLTEQKGFGYIIPILQRLMDHKIQLIIVGTGDPSVCQDLSVFAEKHTDQFAFINGFSNEYAHLVEAGADFFLMPSQFEPCGLNQMYSLAYGTLPIVRAVGGLKDTVIDPEQDKANATGFMFTQPSPQALLDCIRRALLFYYEDDAAFTALQTRSMSTRFTWEDAANQYSDLYQLALL